MAQDGRLCTVGILVNEIGQAAGIFGDGSDRGGGVLAGFPFQLEPFDLGGESDGLHIAHRCEAQERPDVLSQEVQLAPGQIEPVGILPGTLDLRIDFLDRIGVEGYLGDLGAQVGDHLPGFGGLLVTVVTLQQVQPGVEKLDEDGGGGRIFSGFALLEVVLPEVYDLEPVLSAVGQPFGMRAGVVVPRAAAEHLLQLDGRVHGAHEDQVHSFGHIDTGLQHVHGDGHARQRLPFEGLDGGALMLRLVGDHPRQVGILGKHLVEHFEQAQGVGLGHGEEDGLARQLARLVLETDVPDLLPLPTEGILVGNPALQVGSGEINGVWVISLVNQGLLLFLGEVHSPDALALELGLRGVQFVVHQIAFVRGFLARVEEGGYLVSAVELQKGVAVYVLGRGSGQTDHEPVEVLEHLVPLVEDGAVNLVKDDQVEEGGREILIAVAQGLQGDDKQAIGFDSVGVMGEHASAGLVWQEVLKAFGERLAHQGVAVGHEQDVAGLVGAHEDVGQGHGDAGFAGACGHDEQSLALLFVLESVTKALHGLQLVGSVGDLEVDGCASERRLVLANVEEIVQVGGGEKAGHLAGVGVTHVPELGAVAVGHEGKGGEVLAPGDPLDVELGLGLGEAWVNAGALGLDDGDDVAIGAVEYVVADPLRQFGLVDYPSLPQASQPGFERTPRLRFKIIHGDLDAHLVGVIDVPACFFQGGVN